MRKIKVARIKEATRKLVISSNINLRTDIKSALVKASKAETKALSRRLLRQLIKNSEIAKKRRLAICQDTGMAFVFLEIGQNALLVGGDINKAVNEGVRLGYKDGFFRKSVVNDPILRKNTKTNTPAVIHYEIIKGNKVRLTVAPKGFGCENKSAVKMFNPTAGIKEIERFIIDTVTSAGPDACPPFIVGVGIGGTMDTAALLSKKALLRNVVRNNPKRHIAALERRLFARINKLKVGPMGLGGKTTALAVNILSYPTHIAGLPVAVNIGCHATRNAQAII